MEVNPWYAKTAATTTTTTIAQHAIVFCIEVIRHLSPMVLPHTGCPKNNVLLAHLWVSDLSGGVKNNSKNFGNRKIKGSLAKCWENELYLFKKFRNFSDFMSLWPSLESKTFLDDTKVNIYAANKIVENNDFLKDFWHFLTDKAIKIWKNWKILNKKNVNLL